ncbi:hypothetical protein PVBG_06119 [Plasmodium vivax Brazil I]|uniref:Uncharacterized protein n=1 Tax=Plasmodium vivax (strain Brazil I) TaxID=1033975 RepID=A0A0J9SZY6_PLAV1|nr:hypothetical protein PVBG_06119 [Plasmodium vivax Brazil I]
MNYIDYNCYDCLKYEFQTCYLTEGGKAYLSKSHDTRNPKIRNFTYEEDILKWIVKHLGCTRIFLAGHTNVACKYINFWLNDKIKVLYTYVSDSYFKNYEEFVKKFYTKVEGYKSFKSCTNNIKFLKDDDEYKKMYMLYKLYEKYDDLKKIHEEVYTQEKTCEIIQYITRFANDVARSYKDDDKFIEALRDLRETIKNGEGKYKKLCASDLNKLDTMVTLAEFPNKEPDPPTHTDIQQPAVSLEQTRPQTLAHVSENAIRNPLEPNVGLPENPPTEQLRSGEHRTEVSHAMLPPEAQQHRGSSIGASHHESSREEGEFHEELLKSAPFSGEQYGRSRYAHSRSGHSRYNSLEERVKTEGVLPSSNDVEGTSSSVMSTITSALRDVEPGPVLGVSGGMGVLFLLFKVFTALKIYLYFYNTFK